FHSLFFPVLVAQAKGNELQSFCPAEFAAATMVDKTGDMAADASYPDNFAVAGGFMVGNVYKYHWVEDV
ncbi:MAG: hypothetical protein Q8O52_18055, partial [Sulfuritalea sp.]|nr:hypothetical protein [Sulfuritalea sp.]